MTNSRFFSYIASFFILPLALFAVTGCGGQEATSSEDNPSSQESTPLSQTTPTPPPAQSPPSNQPALNPEGNAGPSEAVVVFPNGGEQLEVGKPYEITWESQGFNKINISLEEEGYGRGEIAKEILASQKKFIWTPSLEDGIQDDHIMNLQIVLSDSQTGEVLDKSDDSFIIIEATPE
ncbi:hypothetical protein K9M59_03035 [Candidatus Gracilibacteria bacterium]|nr:hypothetical protein [Candidatus Gracilibacteria bacterium]MCF7819306.1 hypothetical protein [Candidatus Gracilibacteria bacterium]